MTRANRLPIEVALVAGLLLVTLGGTRGAALNQSGHHALDPAAYALLLAAPLLLPFRWRWPAPTIVAVLLVTVPYYGLNYPYGPAFLSLTVALFHAVATGHRIAAWSLGAGGLAAYYVFAQLRGEVRPTVATIAAHLAWLIVVLTVSELIAVRRTRAREARRAREEADALRATEERLQIARELHDVIGHSVSLINVQAAVGLHLMDKQPERARAALEAIKAASKDVLDEVQSALTTLRGGDDGPPAPTPDLDRLDDLVGQCASAGLTVTVTTRGDRRPAGASVELAAFRIVQEALTNVMRHSGASAASVAVAYEPERLVVTITDPGGGHRRAKALQTHGRGIIGMRERAAALGGDLSAGPAPDGGFRVHANLPITREPTT